MAEATLNDISAQLKEQNKGDKKQTAILQKIGVSLAGPSASQLAEAEQEKKIPAEGGVGGGGGGGKGLKGMMGIFKKLSGFINMIKKGVLLLLLPAILMFLNSPFFKKALTFIKDTLMPALKKVWEWLKTLFTDPMQALKDLWDGILDGAADIGTFLWEKGIKPFWTWLKGVFTGMDWAALWSKAIDGASSIGVWIWNKAIKPFWTWIKDMFTGMDWADLWSKAIGGAASIGLWIWNKAIKPFWTWIKDMFTGMDWADLWSKAIGGAASIGVWIWNKAIKPFWDWIKDMFKGMDWADLWSKAIGGAASIGLWIWNKAVKPFWTWIKGVFTTTDWAGLWTGLWGAFTSIGGWIWDKAVKPFWTWIKGVFSFKSADAEDDDSKKGILGYVKDMVSGIWTWFKGLFSWGTTDETDADKDDSGAKLSVSGILKSMLDGIKTWLGNMFSFDSTSDIFATAFNVLTFVPNIVLKGLTLISEWLLKLFGFDSAAEKVANASGWTIGSMIVGAFKAVKDWIVGLFTWGTTDETAAEGTGDEKFSLSGILKSMIDGVKEWLGKMFKFDSAADVISSIINVVTFVPNILKDMIVGVTKWLLGIFGFDDAAQNLANANDWTIGSLITGVFEDIIAWFGKILDIDIGAMFKKIAGAAGKAGSWILKTLGLGGGDDKEEGDTATENLPNTAPPGFGTTPHTGTTKKLRQGMAGYDKQQQAMAVPLSRKQKMSSLESSIQRQEKMLAGDRVKFRPKKEAELAKMQAKLATLQAEQMKFDDSTRKAAAALLLNYNAGPPGMTSTNVSINAPSTANTTAVSNVSESLTGAGDPYIAIAGSHG